MSPPLKLHGYAASINVRKVLWMADELGLAVERQDWGGVTRSTREPAFRALNPVGMVPVIDDAGVIVWESNAIVRYLAASRGRQDLLPAEPAARARVEQWMDWQASDLNNSWRYAFQALVRRNPACVDEAAIASSLAQLTELVGIIGEQLEQRGGYIAGPTFTVADIAIGLSIHRWRSILTVLSHAATASQHPEELERARRLNARAPASVLAYYQRLEERPGFARHGRDGGP
jgi:glutathione S-transferase